MTTWIITSLGVSLWSKRNGRFWPSVSEFSRAIEGTIPIQAAVCQKLVVFKESKKNPKTTKQNKIRWIEREAGKSSFLL